MLVNLRKFLRRFNRNHAAVLGVAIVAVFAALSGLAGLIFPFDPYALGPLSFKPPSAELFYTLGSDDLGRSTLGQLLYGGRVSMTIGLVVAIASVTIGVSVGVVSGYFGGTAGEALMRFTEIFMIIPRFFLALILVAVLGPSIFNIMAAITFTSWPVIARIVRAEALTFKEKEFVEAARATGETDTRIMFSEILPNCIPPVIVNASLLVGQAILTEASLSFLGLGDPGALTWGYMLYNAQPFLRFAWWMAVFPGFAIALVVLGLNLIGDGLNDAFNPKLRQM